MRVLRLNTEAGKSPLTRAPSRLYHDSAFIEYAVPAAWGESAAEVLVRDVYCRKPVAALLKPVTEDGVPEFLWRRIPDEKGLDGISAEWRYRHERDFGEVFTRIACGLAYHGWKAGMFDGAEDAAAFVDELVYLLLHQMAAPEIALLASAGLDWAYGADTVFTPAARIAGFSDALFGRDIRGAGVTVAPDAPEQNLLKRLLLLAERQSLDADGHLAPRIAVTLPAENADSPAFIDLKRATDAAACAQELGARMLRQALRHVMDACDRDALFGFDPERNLKLRQAMMEARRAGVTEAAMRAAIQYAQQGMEDVPLLADMPEASVPPLLATLSVPDELIESALTGHGFLLSQGGQATRHYPAEKLWDSLAAAIWSAGEPAVFFRDSAAGSTMTAGADIAAAAQGGFLFLPDTAAPGATLHLPKFMKTGLDAEKLAHAAGILAIALDISFVYVDAGARTAQFRPVAIGISGIAPMLMAQALPYDSEEGRATAALAAALVTGAVTETSAALASTLGAFPGYKACEKDMLQALKDKISALSGTAHLQKGLSRRPAELKPALCPDTKLPERVKASWARAYAAAREHGLRHAHVTSAGTDENLQALLGAQARDIAPVAALVRFEGHFGDGPQAEIYGKKLSPAVPQALLALGFSAREIDDVTFYAAGHGTLLDAPGVNHATLRTKGFHRAALDALEAALATAQHIRYVFNKWTLGDDFCRHMLGFTEAELASGTFDMLSALGFSEDDIDAANLYCCGAMNLEGAPHLRPQQVAVFDCAQPSGAGVRCVSPAAQVRMQAAIEPFLSGAIFHTVELGHYTTIDEVQKLVLLGWELGVKRLKLYRDGCSLLHPVALPLAEDAADDMQDDDAAQALPATLRFART